MDLFEEHFANCKKSEEIFESYKNSDKGIILSNELKDNFSKKGSELLTKKEADNFLEIRGIYYTNVVKNELKDYSFYEWLVCLEQKKLLEYVVPVFSNVLVHYPILYGIHYHGEVLYQITIIESDFWENHFGWKEYFISIVNDVLSKYTITELTNIFPEEYISQFEKFVLCDY